tara:strand:- start:16 stop:363 length:348 start_codon:yes stop_codon:yes gene_type:complete
MKYCSDFSYDLEVGQVFEKELAYIFEGKFTVECKRDLQANETGNVFVEYESRGKPSGLATSQADYWAFSISDSKIRIIKTNQLKINCRKYLYTHRNKRGGDNNSSKGILLPIEEL